MFLIDILFALFFAMFLSALFVFGFRRPGPWANLLVFFLIVFLASWAGGVWMTPLGPPLWGSYWLPFFFMALVIALVIAAAAPVRPPRDQTEAEREAKAEAATEAAFGVFLWVLLLVLAFAVFAYYV